MIMMAPIAFVMAGQEGPIFDVTFLLIMGAGILLVGVISLAVHFLRRMVLDKSRRKTDGDAGFTMEQIDRLRNEDVLTDEEHRLARRSVLGLNEPDTPEQ